MRVQANGVSIEVEDSAPGDTRRPVVLLIMGLGMQPVSYTHLTLPTNREV